MAIDIKKIEELDFSKAEDLQQLASIITTEYDSSKPVLTTLSQVWEENINFFEGNQWISWSNSRKQWGVIPKTDANAYIPRPTSNYILPGVQSVAALMTKNKPVGRVFPNSDNDQDINAAKVAEKVLDAKYDVDEELQNSVIEVMMAAICGTVFRKDFANMQKGPWLNGIEDGEDDLKDGMFAGDNEIKILSPMEVWPDIYDNNFFIESQVKGVDWIKKQYSIKKKGYTGLAKDVKSANSQNFVLSTRERLRFTAGMTGESDTKESTLNDRETNVVLEVYLAPTPKFKKGLCVVVCDNKVLYVNDYEFFVEGVEDSWHPYSYWHWQKSPLRWHGISLVEQVVPLNRQINQIDALIALNRQTHASPPWIIPTGSGIPENFPFGKPNVVIRANPVGPGQLMPNRLPGTGLPADVYREREIKENVIHQIMGDNQVLSGNNPTGVGTYSQLNLLLEQSVGRFGIQLQSREKFIECSQRKKLILISKLYTEPRGELTQRMRQVANGETDLAIQDFIGSDLRDNYDFRIETGSAAPRSKLAEQALLLDLQQRGLLGDVSTANPVANAQFLQKFGINSFSGVTNNDVVRAKHNIRMLHAINQGMQPPEAYPSQNPFDDIDTHMKLLVEEMKKPDFKDPMRVFESKFSELNNLKSAIKSASMPPQEQMQGQVGGKEIMPSEENSLAQQPQGF